MMLLTIMKGFNDVDLHGGRSKAGDQVWALVGVVPISTEALTLM